MKNIKDEIRLVAEPVNRGEKIHDAIARAARRVKVAGLNGDLESLSFSRAYEIWYGRARVEPREDQAIRQEADKRRREIVRDQIHSFKTSLALMEARLASVDADFHSETIDALCELSRGFGGMAPKRG